MKNGISTDQFISSVKRNDFNTFLLVSLIVFFGLFTCWERSWGADFYVTQNASGSDSGSDCSNAHSADWLNTPGNWSNLNQTGKISPGDTVHLCDIISTPIIIQGNGSNGSAITILFESGAKLSRPHWNQNGSNGDAAIYGNGVSYITIDGGVNGTIEATDNGTNKTYHLQSVGIDCSGCSYMTVEKLNIQNMYERAGGPDVGMGDGIYFHASHDITIQHNIVNQAYVPIAISYRPGDQNIYIHDNSAMNAGIGIWAGSGNTGSTINNVLVYNNNLSKGSGTWSGNPDIHTNCMHFFAVHSGSRIDGLKIYGNRVTGDWGTNSTSYIFLEGYVYSPQIYNNLFIAGDPGAGGGNGLLVLKGTHDALVANNTFISNGGYIGIGIGDSGYGATGNIIENNLMYDVGAPISSSDSTTAISESDYNIFYLSTGKLIFNWGSWGQREFDYPATGWKQVTGFDSHTAINQPSLDANYIPASGDTVAKDQGVSFSSYFRTDKDGIPRPQGPAWDIGAYEYVAGRDTVPPAAPLGLEVK